MANSLRGLATWHPHRNGRRVHGGARSAGTSDRPSNRVERPPTDTAEQGHHFRRGLVATDARQHSANGRTFGAQVSRFPHDREWRDDGPARGPRDDEKAALPAVSIPIEIEDS